MLHSAKTATEHLKLNSNMSIFRVFQGLFLLFIFYHSSIFSEWIFRYIYGLNLRMRCCAVGKRWTAILSQSAGFVTEQHTVIIIIQLGTFCLELWFIYERRRCVSVNFNLLREADYYGSTLWQADSTPCEMLCRPKTISNLTLACFCKACKASGDGKFSG